MAWISTLLSCLPTINPAPPALSSSTPPNCSIPLEPRGAAPTRPQEQLRVHAQLKSRRDEFEARKRRLAERAWEEWQRDYASGKFDLETVPPPRFHPAIANSPSSPTSPQPEPHLFPPYAPLPSPSEPIRQRAIDKLEPYKHRPLPPPPSSRPERPRKSSKRPKSSPRLNVSTAPHLPTPPLMPPSSGPSPDLAALTYPPVLSASTNPSPALSSSRQPSLPTLASTQSFPPLVQHPFCLEIVASAIETFGTDTALLSILDKDKMAFLASSGVEQSVKSIPRQATFCAHTVLNGVRGFVVLDTTQDWRFANNDLTVQHGVRFYAGAPIFASKDLRNPQAEQVPVGTLCVTDKAPRKAFSKEEREKLASLAALASFNIDAWARARLEAKIALLDSAYEGWKRTLSSLSSSSFALSTENDQNRRSVASSVGGKSNASRPTTAGSTSGSKSRFILPTDESALSPGKQSVVDAATQTIARTMDLPLVYVLALTPADAAFSSASSASAAPTSSTAPIKQPPSSSLTALGFNVPLHLAALAAPEGGILYENTSSSAPASSPPSGSGSAESTYSGGILLAVRPSSGAGAKGKKPSGGRGEVGEGEGGGTVLAVFIEDAKRVWGKEDLAFLRKFAAGLGEVVGVGG